MSVVANVAINVDSSGAVSKLQQVQTQAQQTEKAFGGIAAAVGKLAIAFGTIQSVKFVFAKASELESQTKSLEVLTGSVQKAKSIIAELQQLGAVTPFTSTELIDAAKRLNAFGVEGDKVVETTRRLADVSGATGAELQGLVTAYGQVQAKGRLQGEELLQFQERGIALQGELRKMYGMTGDEFQKALSKGRISAEAVEVAIQRLTDAGGKYANGAVAQSDTLNGKLSTLQDSFQRLAANIGTFFAPAFKFLISKTDELINRLNRGAFGVQAEMRQRAGAEKLSRAGVTERTYKDAQGNVYSTITGRLVQAAKPRTATATGAAQMPALLEETGAGKPAKASTAAADDAKRVAEQIKQQLKSAQDLKFEQQNRLTLLRAENDFTKAFTSFSIQRLEIERRYSELLKQSKSPEETATLQQARSAEYKQSSLTLQQQINDLLKQAQAPLNDAVESIKNQAAFEREYGELIKNGTNPEVAKQVIAIRKAYNESVKLLEPALAAAQAAVTKAEAEGASATNIQKYREELEKIKAIRKGLAGKKAEGETAAAELNKPKTPTETIEGRISTLKTEIAELTNIGNIAIKVADGIGAAFGQAFEGLITGSMSAQEALGNFFKSIGDMFINMATEIIAKQMVMITLGFIMKALGLIGNISSAGNAAGAAAFSPGNAAGLDAIPGQAFSLPKLAANGATFSNGIAKFATGGIVGSPTLFPFADGGAMQMGLMGEAGPEAIMPLQRGADGSLGVRAAMGGNGMGGSSSPILNMSFETSTINGVEYVSRDQLELAMAQTRRQASRDGANKGMAMTLDKIQQSPQTRRRIGM